MNLLSKNMLVNLQNRILLASVTRGFLKNVTNDDFVRLGSNYGGWWIPKLFLSKFPADLTVVSVGLGSDVSFDKEVLKFGGKIIGLDPIPSSIEYARHELADFDSCTLINKGLWTFSGTEFFAPPKVDGFVSWQITSLQDQNNLMEFEVMTVQEICTQFIDQESEDFVMIKMDIEGAELQVFEAAAKAWGSFDLIAAEMDFLAKIPFIQIRKRILSFLQSRDILKQMEELNFTLVKVENFNFYWLKNTLISRIR